MPEINHPIIQSAILPLLTTLLLAPVFATISAKTAGATIGIGFLVGYLCTMGIPNFPPVSAAQKLPYLITVGLLAGLILDLRGSRSHLWITAGSSVVAIGWLTWPRFDIQEFGTLAINLLTVCVVMFRSSLHSSSNTGPALLIGSLGLAAIAYAGSSSSIAQASGALAASTGAFMIWNWPKKRWDLGTAALLSGVGAWCLLATQCLHFTTVSPSALLVLSTVFIVDLIFRNLHKFKNKSKVPIECGLAAIPAIAAIAIAFK